MSLAAALEYLQLGDPLKTFEESDSRLNVNEENNRRSKASFLVESHFGGDGLLWYNLNTGETSFTIPHESAWERKILDDDHIKELLS